jgi:trk system potassium uptake protein
MPRFVVIGLGRFGSRLARELSHAGVEVIAIDKNRRLVEEISKNVTLAVSLDSTDEQALRAQGVDKVDVAVVGIGQDFESNILTTVILKSMGVKYVCARAEQETHGRILSRIGADEIIFPEDESAHRWAFKLLAPQISERLEFAEGLSLAKYAAAASFVGKTLRQLDLRNKYHVNLIGVRHMSETMADTDPHSRQIINMPLPDTIIQTGDILWLVGRDEDLTVLPNK